MCSTLFGALAVRLLLTFFCILSVIRQTKWLGYSVHSVDNEKYVKLASVKPSIVD
jgi:hypothetical protein